MNPPKVSVCIPVYNGEKFIGKAVRSVLEQTFDDFELIICDNASTDKTQDAVEQFRDGRIRYILNEANIGMYPNFNKCIRKAKGEYIKFLCSDDLLAENCLEEMVEVLDKNEEAEIATALDVYIDEEGEIIKVRDPFYEKEGLYSGPEIVKKMFRQVTGSYVNSPSHVMVRNRDDLAFDNINEDGWANDTELWMRLLSKGDLYFLDRQLVFNRRHQGSLSSTQTSLRIYKEYMKAFEKFRSKELVYFPFLDVLLMRTTLINRLVSDRNFSVISKIKFLEEQNLLRLLPISILYLIAGKTKSFLEKII